jgi:hypothetical protein
MQIHANWCITQSEWYNIHILVHVCYALIFGLEVEPLDEGIIVHVFLLW